MAMKEETKRNFEDGLYKGKKALMQIQVLATEQGQELKFKQLWDKLDGLQKILDRPGVDTVEVSNKYNATARSIQRFVGLMRGEIMEEDVATPDDVLGALEDGNPIKAIGLYVQAGSQSIMRGYELAMQVNPWADSLPVFQELKVMAAKIQEHVKTIVRLPPPKIKEDITGPEQDMPA